MATVYIEIRMWVLCFFINTLFVIAFRRTSQDQDLRTSHASHASYALDIAHIFTIFARVFVCIWGTIWWNGYDMLLETTLLSLLTLVTLIIRSTHAPLIACRYTQCYIRSTLELTPRNAWHLYRRLVRDCHICSLWNLRSYRSFWCFRCIFDIPTLPGSSNASPEIT